MGPAVKKLGAPAAEVLMAAGHMVTHGYVMARPEAPFVEGYPFLPVEDLHGVLVKLDFNGLADIAVGAAVIVFVLAHKYVGGFLDGGLFIIPDADGIVINYMDRNQSLDMFSEDWIMRLRIVFKKEKLSDADTNGEQRVSTSD